MTEPARHAEISGFAELDLRPTLLGDEDPLAFETFRAGILADLAPRTAYQRTMAENLVALEWEVLRHRRLRDALIGRAFRIAAAKAIGGHDPDEFVLEFRKDEDLARALLSGPEPERRRAAAALDDSPWSRAEIAAIAFDEVAKRIEPHERKLAELESRRRRLLDDYQRLQDMPRRRAAEDARIVEDDG